MACRMILKSTFWTLTVVAIVMVSSCSIGFKGISIPPTVTSYFVEQFQNGVGNAPPDIGQRFSDELKDLVTRNSRLDYSEDVPDIEFSGTITSFSVTSVAPERISDNANVTEFGSSLNRLNISVNVDYISNQDEEDNWTQTFSFFEDFESGEILTDVQDELIDKIFDQITNDIFNKAFTSW